MLVGTLSLLCPLSSIATAQKSLAGTSDKQLGSLSEIRPDHKALLLVLKSTVISADDSNRTIIDLVLKADPEPTPRHRGVYGVLARKLNSYIRKYRSLAPAVILSEADCVIFFSLIGYRRILDVSYPFGELFVIVKGEPETNRPPHVVWKSKKVEWAGDAIDDFLKDLKNNRGEI
jgi:hypothetical protein